MASLNFTHERIEDWDCDFLYTPEEIAKWRDNKFYCFILGQHTIHGKVNARYREDWENSNYYRRGRARAFREVKATNKYKFRRGYTFESIKKPIPREVTIFKESFIRYKGRQFKAMIPRSTRVKFVPQQGLNYTIDANKGPYIYDIRDHQYIFLWKRVYEDMPFDFTSILMGRGHWPERLKKVTLNFDVDWINQEGIREYHFINFVLSKKKRSWAIKSDWDAFRRLIVKNGTIY